MKMYWKSSNVPVICVNNLEITSERCSLDLCNKIWIGPFIDIVFLLKSPRLGFSFLPPVSFEII